MVSVTKSVTVNTSGSRNAMALLRHHGGPAIPSATKLVELHAGGPSSLLEMFQNASTHHEIDARLLRNDLVLTEAQQENLIRMIDELFGREKSMDFGQALEKLKEGKKIARKGWNGKGMFIYLVRGRPIDKEFLRNEASNMPITDNTGVAHFNAHIDMKTADGSVTVGWAPSQVDMLAEDWEVVE